MGASADSLFERFVALGDSLSQGTWNVGTAADSQPWGLPALLARQAGAQFRLPLLEPPGNPPQIRPIGRLLRTPAHLRSDWGRRLNPEESIENFAVPGARLSDVLDLTPAGLASAHRPAVLKSLYRRILNPLDDPHHEHATQLDRAIAADPTMVHVLVGANDVLECFFHTSYRVTPPVEFRKQWHRLLDRLLTETTAIIVIIGVPQLTVAPAVQVHRRRTGLIRDCGATIAAYNRILADSAAGRDRVLLVDLNPGLLEAASDGIPVDDWGLPYRVRTGRLTLAPPVGRPGDLWHGGLISYDGLHPTMTGYAMLANGVIQAVNERFGLQVGELDLPAIAARDPLLCQPSSWLWAASAITQRLTFHGAVTAMERDRWPIPPGRG